MQRRKLRTRVGDYLRYDRFKGEALDEPLWAVVIEMEEFHMQGKARVVLHGSAEYYAPTFTFFHAQVDKASYTTVPPDEVPDHVLVEIARHALLGS